MKNTTHATQGSPQVGPQAPAPLALQHYSIPTLTRPSDASSFLPYLQAPGT